MVDRRELFVALRRVDLRAWDDDELVALTRFVTAVQKRRDILEVQRQINGADTLTGRRIERVRRHAQRGNDITAALRELRDAATYSTPRPTLFVVRDDDEPSNPQP